MPYESFRMEIAVALLLCSLVFTTGCEKSSPKPEKEQATEQASELNTTQTLPAQYHFQAKYKDVAGITEVLINGFPVNRAGGSITNNPVVPHDLNTALIGEGNELTIRVEPRMLRGGGLSISTVKVYGKVTRDYEGEHPVPGAKITEAEVDSVYAAWTERAREKWQTYRSTVEQGALDSIRAWASRNPLTVTTTFDNEAGPDFSKIFEEAPKLEDTPATRKRLKDYAIRLRDLLRSGDAEAIYQEIQPSVSEETGWFKVTRSGRRDSALAQIRREWTEDFQLDFSRSEIGLRQWSSGRVWELFVRRPEGEERPFFWEGPSASYLKVYVAEMGGTLRIVRLDV